MPLGLTQGNHISINPCLKIKPGPGNDRKESKMPFTDNVEFLVLNRYSMLFSHDLMISRMCLSRGESRDKMLLFCSSTLI